MARKVDEDATVIDAYPQAFFGADDDSASAECTKPRLQENRPVAFVVDGKAEDANLGREVEAQDALLELGAEDHFILAWGRANAAVASKGRQLLMSSGLNVALVLAVAFLAWRNEHKETYVFVRDALGNITAVCADLP